MRTGILMIAAMLAFLGASAKPVLAADGAIPEMQTLFNDARELAAKGRLEESMAAYAGLLRRWPLLAEAHNNLGVLQMRAGQLTAAEASFKAALRLRPDFGAALENMGDLHARFALASWEAASRADADDPQVRDKRHRLLPLLDVGPSAEGIALSPAR